MKTAIYIRTAKGNEVSTETQIEWCKSKLKPNDEYVIFSDNGYSSYDNDKPAFNEMMSAIEHDEIDTVIVYKFDRICRSIKSFYSFTDTLRRYGVTFISVIERLDSSSWNGNSFLTYLGVLSEIERKNHSERCRRGWERRKQRMEGC